MTTSEIPAKNIYMKIVDIQAGTDRSNRFEKKRSDIIDAACTLINEVGVKGMTFVDIAQMVGLNTTSVTYYFKRKEQLAAAAFERSLERIENMVREAATEPDPQSRVSAYLKLSFDRFARVRRAEERPITHLSDIRAMDEPIRTQLSERYLRVFGELRGFFGEAASDRDRQINTARAHVLIENIFWLPAWLVRYSTSDFDRLRYRLDEIFRHGFAPSDADWTPVTYTLPDHNEETESEIMPAIFLRAATRLINERGYRGASVERIASELNVTKGSFYHHLEAKDDLVLACFEHSYRRVSKAQRLADAAKGSQWQIISSAIATLLNIQFFSDFPLLRTTALQALPNEHRSEVVDRSNRMAWRFGATLIDGITDKSILPVDPMIAGQAVMATLNSAYELRSWAVKWDPAEAIAIYAGLLTFGLYSGLEQENADPAGSRKAGQTSNYTLIKSATDAEA